MSRLRVHAFSVSIDGYGTGPNQSVDLRGLGYECTQFRATPKACQIVLTKR
jgi:hypothetical protein